MENLDLLYKHLSLKVDIGEDDFNKFVTLTKTVQLKKGDFFLREGRVARYQAFLLRGVLASYSIDEKGEKHVIQIAIEGHWTSDLLSFLTREPSKFNIEALESVKLLVISKENFELACKKIPVFERFYRILIQNAFVHLQRRISNIYGESAEVRYLKLVSEKPEIAQSVPQHYLASYLGIKPQSLSRIRKNIAKNAR
jgi:CRP-like cAMP-binding protein